MAIGSLRWLRGNATALIDRELSRMRSAFRKKYPDGIILSSTVTRETLGDILSELAPSLFSTSQKLILLRVEKPRKRSKNTSDESDTEDTVPEDAWALSLEDAAVIRRGIDGASESVHMMVAWEGGNIPKKDTLSLALEGAITWKEFPLPTRWEITTSLRSRLNIEEVDEQKLLSRYTLLSESDLWRVKPKDLSTVIARVNESLRQLEKDIDTLSLLSAGEDVFVSPQDIAALTGISSASENIFVLIDALIDGSKKAPDLMRNELSLSSPFPILANLLTNFRTQVYLQMLYGRGIPSQRAAGLLGVHSFVAEKAFARRSQAQRITALYKALIELDQGVKTGGLIWAKGEEALSAELEMLACAPSSQRA